MKKLIILLFILSVNYSFAQECKLSSSQLFMAMEYNEADFEKFADKYGFTYYENEHIYYCDESINKNKRSRLLRGVQPGISVLIYSFYGKEDYLAFKRVLDTGKLTGSMDEGPTARLDYLYNGDTVNLQTSTHEDGSLSYLVSITKMKK